MFDAEEFAELVSRLGLGRCRSNITGEPHCEEDAVATAEFVCRNCYRSFPQNYCAVHLTNVKKPGGFRNDCKCSEPSLEIME